MRFCLRAGGFDLIPAERAPTAVAHALRCENLDQIGAIGGDLTDIFVDLVGRELRIAQRPKGSQDSRPRQHSSIDGVPGWAVDGAAHALYGSEPSHQGHVGIFQRVTQGGNLRIVARLVPSIRTEMPGNVNVGIDQARQHRQISQIVARSAGCLDLLDFSVLNHDGDVVPHAALSVEKCAGAQNDRLLLGDRQGGTQQ